MKNLNQLEGKKIKFGLFARTLTALFLLLVSALAVLSYSLLNNAAKQFDEFRLQQAQALSHTLADGSLDALVTEDFELLERFVNSSLPSHFGAYATLSRPNGQILTSTDLGQIGKKITQFENIDDKIYRSLKYKDRPVIEVFNKAMVGNQHLANAHVAYYTDQGNFSYLGQAKDTIIALIISFTVILIGTFYIVSRIRTPILNLISTVINTSLDTPTHMPQHIFWRNDEVGTLAKSFDNVFTRLSSAHQKIQDAKENLEVRVKERTQELADKTEEIDASQKRLNAIMDNAGDSIITINDKGLIESFNIAAQKLFGYSSIEILGKNVSLLMPEPYKGEHDQYIKRYLDTNISHVIGKEGREVTGKRKDNSEFPMGLLISHINLHGNNLFVGIVRDITLEKEAREILQRTNKQLEEEVNKRTIELHKTNQELMLARDTALDASNLKSEFLSVISHELRTPLHAISGYESLLKSTELNEQQQQYCSYINVGSEKLLDIINELLDFSQFESGQLRVQNTKTSLEKIVHDVCKMFIESVEKKKLILSCNIDKSIPDSIYTDSKQIRKILVHLISNAIKFTAKGSVTVNATLNTHEDKSQFINISVIDTGIGIDKSQFERIFNAFYQVDGTVTRAYGGTGLGLAVSRKIIELMGGDISLQSTPEQGSTFTITFPLSAKDSYNKKSIQKDKYPEKTSELITSDTHNKKSPSDYKIIIVEDNDINQELLLLQLNDLGYTADTAENGQVFLDMMNKNHYDLVLMDCQMPILNGYDATQQYRSSEDPDTHIPIIGVTANTMPGDKEKCIASGMDDYIEKPVASDILKKTVRHWLSEVL